MSKVVGMLVALALFALVPSVAAAQGTSPSGGGGTVSSGNTQGGTINQGANSGDNGFGDGTGFHHGSSGGNAGNQACLVQQNAGRDANAACSQTQNFSSENAARRSVSSFSNGVGNVSSSSRGVRLAYTGFDAWVLVLIGGVAIAGGLGLLVAGRRGRSVA